MRTAGSPFTDPGRVRGPLYATPDRLARRTSALHRARGRNAAEVIADLAASAIGTESALVADVGSGVFFVTVSSVSFITAPFLLNTRLSDQGRKHL
jgi:hypothetical protein